MGITVVDLNAALKAGQHGHEAKQWAASFRRATTSLRRQQRVASERAVTNAANEFYFAARLAARWGNVALGQADMPHTLPAFFQQFTREQIQKTYAANAAMLRGMLAKAEAQPAGKKYRGYTVEGLRASVAEYERRANGEGW